jgi:hypothetical protein
VPTTSGAGKDATSSIIASSTPPPS